MKKILLFLFLLIPSYADLEKDFFSKKNSTEIVSLRLRFQEVRGNYLVFYHSEGYLFLLAFRKHRWDYSHDEFLKNLQPGNEYQVQFQWFGFFFTFPDKYQSLNNFLANQNYQEKTAHEIREKQKFGLGQIIKIDFSLLQDLRF